MLQVYDIVIGKRVFEQELYNQFTYSASVPFFHQFEAEVGLVYVLHFSHVLGTTE